MNDCHCLYGLAVFWQYIAHSAHCAELISIGESGVRDIGRYAGCKGAERFSA